MADELTKILIELVRQLPPDMRPWTAAVLGHAAETQTYWQPALTMLLAVIVFSSITIYVEAMDA